MTDVEHQPTSGPWPWLGAGILTGVGAAAALVAGDLDRLAAVLAVVALVLLGVGLRGLGGRR
ncbi:hypothetical protein [Nocardioides sp. LML1-1-1.1]|uniref:hypothetical protein n=1 Tax=Nocardioides sp. LML1-1-1.1 TaxID=3135248 RepID=UPI003428AE83